METNVNRLEKPDSEKVDGGCLPDWEVADLPAPPPYKFGRAFRSVLGPGIIMLGTSIGSGEWLLGPAITARYGRRLDHNYCHFSSGSPKHRSNSLYNLYW